MVNVILKLRKLPSGPVAGLTDSPKARELELPFPVAAPAVAAANRI